MLHFFWPLGLSCLALGMIACGSPAPSSDAPTQVSPAPEPSQSSQGAASAQSIQSDSAQANSSEMVLDLRVLPHDIAAQDVTSPIELQTITEQVYGEDRSDLLTVMGPVSGSFTAAGQSEMLYLLLPAGRQAASPEPAVAPILAVFAGGALQGQVALRPRQQTAIAAVVDSNGDGIDEILMRSDFFQMGISGATLDLISIADYQEIQLAGYDAKSHQLRHLIRANFGR
jgi:hypothetical protein